MEHLNMAQAAGIAALGQTGLNTARLPDPTLCQQILSRLSNIEEHLSCAGVDLTMVSDRTFGATVEANNTGPSTGKPECMAEQILFQLDLLTERASRLADRARGLNVRL